MNRLLLAACVVLAACSGGSSTAPISLDDPSGSYQLHAVNRAELPYLLLIQPSPFIEKKWTGGTLDLSAGHWTETLATRITTKDGTTTQMTAVAGTYARVDDHLEFTLDPGQPVNWDSVEVVRATGSQLNVAIGETMILTFNRK